MSSTKSTPASQSKRTTATKPVRNLRLGRLKAAIWANPNGDGRTFYNVTFSRTYRDEAGSYHDTDSFGRDDLLPLGKLADQAHTIICELLAAEKIEDKP